VSPVKVLPVIVVSAGEPAKIAPPTLLELSLENVAPLTDSVLPAARAGVDTAAQAAGDVSAEHNVAGEAERAGAIDRAAVAR